MLVQYFIHKEFVEPKIHPQKFSEAATQCNMDKEPVISVYRSSAQNLNSEDGNGTPMFNNRTG
jgi:hypothetical protein